eukprot:scaffold23144_cov39-Tisochrysis_lutea.AAC.4
MALRQARTHALVACWPCWSAPKPHSTKRTCSRYRCRCDSGAEAGEAAGGRRESSAGEVKEV